MAEVQQNDSGKGKKGAQKKMHIRVDFTPMVDMNMLLITFFMLCTTMIKSQTLTIALPSNEKVENQENMSQASADDAITIILDAKRKDGSNIVDSLDHRVQPVVYYYEGKPEDALADNSRFMESKFLARDEKTGAARGIREIIQKRNKDVLEQVEKLKKQYEEGKFGSLETKAEREEALKKYQEACAKVRRDDNLKKPVIVIKATPEASYESLVSILDEMQINQISKYQIDNMTSADTVMIMTKRGLLK